MGNDYSLIQGQIDAEQEKAKATSSLQFATESKLDPSLVSKVRVEAAKENVPFNQAAEKYKVQQAAKQQQFDALPPLLHQLLTIPGVADLTKDKIPELKAFGEQVTKFPSSFSSAMDEPERQGLIYRKNTGQKFTKQDQSRLDELTRSQASGSLLGELAGGLAGTVKEGAPEILGGAIAGAGASVAPAVVGAVTGVGLGAAPFTVGAGVVSGAGAGFAAAGAQQGYVQGYNEVRDFGEKYRDAYGHPINPGVVESGARLAGVLNGGLNIVQIGALGKAIPGFNQLIKQGPKALVKFLLEKPEGRSLIARVGLQVAEQGGIAGATTFVTELTKSGISLDSKPIMSAGPKIAQSIGTGALGGLILGGAIETGTSAALKSIGKAHNDANLNLDKTASSAALDTPNLKGVRARLGDTELHTLAQKLGKTVDGVKQDLDLTGNMPDGGYPITDGKWAVTVEQNQPLRDAFSVEDPKPSADKPVATDAVNPVAQRDQIVQTLVGGGFAPDQATQIAEIAVRGAATTGLDLSALGIQTNAPLPAGVQGQQGRFGIRLADSANVTTFIHEIGHAFRKELAKDPSHPENAVLNAFVGAKDEKWSRKQEEQYTAAIESYFRTGKLPERAPTTVKNLISDLAQEFQAVYPRATDVPNAVKLTPEMSGHLDRLYQVEREFGGLNLPKATVLETASRVELAKPRVPGVRRVVSNHPLIESAVNFSRTELEMRLGKEFTDSLPESLKTGSDPVDSVGLDMIADFANKNEALNHESPNNNPELIQDALFENPEHAIRVADELKALGNAREASGGANTNRKRVSKDLGSLKLQDLDPNYFALRSRSARIGAEEARAAGNLDLAIELKRVELANAEQFGIVTRGLAEIERLQKTALDVDQARLKELTLNQAIEVLRESKHAVENVASITAAVTGDLFWTKGRTDLNAAPNKVLDTLAMLDADAMSPEVMIRFLEGTRGYKEGGVLSKEIFGRALEAESKAYDMGKKLLDELATILNPEDRAIWSTKDAQPIVTHLIGEDPVTLTPAQQRVADKIGYFLDTNLIEFKGKAGENLFSSVHKSVIAEVNSATHKELVGQMRSIIEDKDFKKTVIKNAGEARYKALVNWVEDFGGKQNKLDWFDRVLNVMRGTFTRGVLNTYNPISASKQLLDIFNGGAASIGDGHVLAGLPAIAKSFVVNGWSVKRQEFALSKSSYLSQEFNRFDADLNDAKLQIDFSVPGQKWNKFLESGGVFLGMADRTGKATVWHAHYVDMLSKGHSEAKAITQADSMTRLVFSSASASSRTSGQRAKGFRRLIAVFSTPLITSRIANQLTLSKGGVAGAIAFTQVLGMGIAGDAMISLMSGYGPADDQEPMDWLFQQIAYRQLSVLSGFNADKSAKALTSGRKLDAAGLIPVIGPPMKATALGGKWLSEGELTDKEKLQLVKSVAIPLGLGPVNGALWGKSFINDRIENVPLGTLKK